MSEEFVSLAAILRPQSRKEPPSPDLSNPSGVEPAVAPLSRETATEHAAALGAVRRFRAAVADALDVAVRRLLGEVAADVLARELRVEAADIASIVAKARERYLQERILVVRVNPRERGALAELDVETVPDATVAPGDVIAELRSGTIDLRLRTRLALALSRCEP